MSHIPDDPETQKALDKVAEAAESVPAVTSTDEKCQVVASTDNIRQFKIVDKVTKPAETKPVEAKPAPQKLTKQQRKDFIYEAKTLHGVSLRKLAKQFGISHQQAKRDYDDIAATVTLEGHEQSKRMLWERLELLTQALMPKALQGNVAAAHELAVISERQARMIGADMPVKVASTTPDGQKWAPLALTLEALPAETLKALRAASDLRILPPVKDAEVVNE